MLYTQHFHTKHRSPYWVEMCLVSDLKIQCCCRQQHSQALIPLRTYGQSGGQVELKRSSGSQTELTAFVLSNAVTSLCSKTAEIMSMCAWPEP